MTLLSRLRAWLRPYPDDAQMQAEMLRRVNLIRADNAGRKSQRTGFVRDIYHGKLCTLHTSCVASGGGGGSGGQGGRYSHGHIGGDK